MKRFLTGFLLIFGYVMYEQLLTKIPNQDFGSIVAQSIKSQDETDNCLTMDFHYLVLDNSQWTSKVRYIEIFLDENAFSEENLKKLFTYLSNQNPEPKNLTIVVKTNWKQLTLPSNCPPGAISGQPSKPDQYDYHQATYYRRDRKKNSEYFHYNPILKKPDFKEIIMKQ